MQDSASWSLLQSQDEIVQVAEPVEVTRMQGI
jgi:hypothetical protein